MTKQETLAEFIGFDILDGGYYQYEGEITRLLPDFEADWNWLMIAVIEAFNTVENIPDEHDSMWDYHMKNIKNCFWSPESPVVCEELFIFVNWYNQIKDKK